MPARSTPKSHPAAKPAAVATPRGWDDAPLERALKVGQEKQLSWPAVAERVGVESDALLSAKVRAKFGDAAVRLSPKPKPVTQPHPQATPLKAAIAPASEAATPAAKPKRVRRSKPAATAETS